MAGSHEKYPPPLFSNCYDSLSPSREDKNNIRSLLYYLDIIYGCFGLSLVWAG